MGGLLEVDASRVDGPARSPHSRSLVPTACLGAEEMADPESWVGQPRTDSFLEEVSVGISEQFTAYF